MWKSNAAHIYRDSAVQSVPHPKPLVHAALLHMLWTHELTADLSEVLWSKTVLRQQAVKDAEPQHR